MSYEVVIVGAGHGGAQAAIALRQQRFQGSILMIGDEPDLPYERPPLSKEYLAGEKPFERLLIRPAMFWEERRIDTALGCEVVRVDPENRQVETRDGSRIGYRHLIWATGGAPRRLTCDGHDLVGVHTVRNRADVDRMASELPGVEQVVVIGGGYIGLEAAAVLSGLGRRVILIEALDRVLARVAGEELSRFYEAEHRNQGVDIRLSTSVDCLVGVEGRVTGVRLASGETIPAAMVVVGIGIEPAVAPLVAAGAGHGNGVVVDGRCRTSLPDVYAIGDCAAHVNRFAGGRTIRLESVQNASDQAAVVAKVIGGVEAHYDAAPWFWSNQFDLKLQTIGLSTGYDATVVRGDPALRSFSIVYLKNGRVVALDCVNSTKDFVQGRKLVETAAPVQASALADAEQPLKSLISA